MEFESGGKNTPKNCPYRGTWGSRYTYPKRVRRCDPIAVQRKVTVALSHGKMLVEPLH